MLGRSRSIDITVPLSPGLPVWPGDPTFALEPWLRLDRGEGCNVSRLLLSSHAGTHVDAPWHMLPDGARLDNLELDDLIGPCTVLDLSHLVGSITAADLATALGDARPKRLLIKTRNSRHWADPTHAFDPTFVALTPDSARWLVSREVRLVGIDYHSIEPFDGDGSTHHILLGAGLVIVETLDLRAVEPGDYDLICLPLSMPGADGSPCRAVLLEHAVEGR